jgi:hypothetical protein
MSSRVTNVEKSVLYSPVWLIPADILTGIAPEVTPRVTLDLLANGRWIPTGRKPVIGPSGVISYPGLGRVREPLTAQPQRYRARFDADPYDPIRPDSYLPLYRSQLDGLEFDASPYDDANPPASEAMPTVVELCPTVAYTFPWDVPILHGAAVAADGTFVADVLIEASLAVPRSPQPLVERTITDRRGAFVLPLRWARTDIDTVVTATDQRSPVTRRGSINVRYPTGLPGNHLIEIR